MSEGELIQDPSRHAMHSSHRDDANNRNNALFAFGWILLGLCIVVLVYLLEWMWQIYKKSDEKDQDRSFSQDDADHILKKSNQNQIVVVKEDTMNDTESPIFVGSNQQQISDTKLNGTWRSPNGILSPTSARIQAFFVRVTSLSPPASGEVCVAGNLNDNSSTMEHSLGSCSKEPHVDAEGRSYIPENITITGPPSEADVRSLIENRQAFDELPVEGHVEAGDIVDDRKGKHVSNLVSKPQFLWKNWRYFIARTARSLDLSRTTRPAPNPASDYDEEEAVGSESLSQRLKNERVRVLQATNDRYQYTERQKKDPIGLEDIDLYDNSCRSGKTYRAKDQGPATKVRDVSAPTNSKEVVIFDKDLLAEHRPRIHGRTLSPQTSLLTEFAPSDAEAKLESQGKARPYNHPVISANKGPKKKFKSNVRSLSPEMRCHESKPRAPVVYPQTQVSPKRVAKAKSLSDRSRPSIPKDTKTDRTEGLQTRTSKQSEKMDRRAFPGNDAEKDVLQHILPCHDKLPHKCRTSPMPIEITALQIPSLSPCSNGDRGMLIKSPDSVVQLETDVSEGVDFSNDSEMLNKNSSNNTEGSKLHVTYTSKSVIKSDEQQIVHKHSNDSVEKGLSKMTVKEGGVPTERSNRMIQNTAGNKCSPTSPNIRRTILDESKESVLSSINAKQSVTSLQLSSSPGIPTQPFGPKRTAEVPSGFLDSTDALVSQSAQTIINNFVSKNKTDLQTPARVTPDKKGEVNDNTIALNLHIQSTQKGANSPKKMPPAETIVKKKITARRIDENNYRNSPRKSTKKGDSPDLSDGKKKKAMSKKKLLETKKTKETVTATDTIRKENGIEQKKEVPPLVPEQTSALTYSSMTAKTSLRLTSPSKALTSGSEVKVNGRPRNSEVPTSPPSPTFNAKHENLSSSSLVGSTPPLSSISVRSSCSVSSLDMSHPLTIFKAQKKATAKATSERAQVTTPWKDATRKKKKIAKKKTKKRFPTMSVEAESSLPLVILESSLCNGDCSAVTSAYYGGTDGSVAGGCSSKLPSTLELKIERTNSKTKSETLELASLKNPGWTVGKSTVSEDKQFNGKSVISQLPVSPRKTKAKEPIKMYPSPGNEASSSKRAIIDDVRVWSVTDKQSPEARPAIPFGSFPSPDDCPNKNGSDVSSLSDAASYSSRVSDFAG